MGIRRSNTLGFVRVCKGIQKVDFKYFEFFKHFDVWVSEKKGIIRDILFKVFVP